MTTRRLRLHLSTALILSLVAGGLMGLNLSKRVVDRAFEYYGFPADALICVEIDFGNNSPDIVVSRMWFKRGVAIDAVVALAILILTGVLCERWIARSRRT